MSKPWFVVPTLALIFAGPGLRVSSGDDSLALKIERLEAENEALKNELIRLRRENAELKAKAAVAGKTVVTPTPKREADAGTEQAIRAVIAKHFPAVPANLDRKKPLSDPPMKLDELDAIELIMDLEERFEIKIPDTAFEKQGAKLGLGSFRVTLEQLTNIVEDCKKTSVKTKK